MFTGVPAQMLQLKPKPKRGSFMIPMKSRYGLFRPSISVSLLSILLLTSSVFGWQQTAIAPAAISELSAAEQQLVNSIKAETIRQVVETLSADDMQGRGTAQPGGDKAASF